MLNLYVVRRESHFSRYSTRPGLNALVQASDFSCIKTRVCAFLERILNALRGVAVSAVIPGRVETITVLLDVRGVPLHQVPVSALTDMTNTLTKQYPFRLNRMLIINDSFFVQVCRGYL